MTFSGKAVEKIDMKTFSRADRVSGVIWKSLSDLLQKGIKDPRLSTVTITGVKMTKDLKIAKVYFTTSNEGIEKKKVIEGFKSAIGYVKRILGQKLGLKYMPQLQFYYDESFDYGAKIDKMLKSLNTSNGSNNSPSKEL